MEHGQCQMTFIGPKGRIISAVQNFSQHCTGRAKEVAQSLSHHIDTTVPDKIKRIPTKCF